jgi:hypothetical protein
VTRTNIELVLMLFSVPCAGPFTTGRDTQPTGQLIDLSLDVAVDTAKVVLDATVSLQSDKNIILGAAKALG